MIGTDRLCMTWRPAASTRFGSGYASNANPGSADPFDLLLNHFTTPDFWDHFNALPLEVRDLADKNYSLLRDDPAHPSLHIKRIKEDLWSVRIGIRYRALAFEVDDGFYWFWIGPHSEYDRLITRL
jgi:hypothetical protein